VNENQRRKFSADFKAQAVELVDMGQPVPQVAQDLEIGQSILYSWVRKARNTPELGSASPRAVGERAEADELQRLRREVADLKLENDILKKAAVIIGTNPRQKGGK